MQASQAELTQPEHALDPALGRLGDPLGVVTLGGNDGYASEVAFTDTVKAIQSCKGSRHAYSRMAQGGWQTTITDDLKVEIESQISVFLAFASADGQPYIRHRGGPPGFVRGHARTHLLNRPSGASVITGKSGYRALAWISRANDLAR